METFFLACFVFGLLFTVVSFALGAVGSLHFGHAGGHSTPHFGHAHAGQAHVGHDAHVSHGGDGRSSLPLLNGSSVIGALTWFGAAGYLLLRLGDWALPGVIIGALLAGAAGWYLIARF